MTTWVEITIKDDAGEARGRLEDWVSAIYSELTHEQRLLVQASVRRSYKRRKDMRAGDLEHG